MQTSLEIHKHFINRGLEPESFIVYNEAGNEEYSFIAYFEKENDLYSVTLPAYPQIKMSGKNKRDIIYHLNDEIMRLMFEDEYTAD